MHCYAIFQSLISPCLAFSIRTVFRSANSASPAILSRVTLIWYCTYLQIHDPFKPHHTETADVVDLMTTRWSICLHRGIPVTTIAMFGYQAAVWKLPIGGRCPNAMTGCPGLAACCPLAHPYWGHKAPIPHSAYSTALAMLQLRIRTLRSWKTKQCNDDDCLSCPDCLPHEGRQFDASRLTVTCRVVRTTVYAFEVLHLPNYQSNYRIESPPRICCRWRFLTPVRYVVPDEGSCISIFPTFARRCRQADMAEQLYKAYMASVSDYRCMQKFVRCKWMPAWRARTMGGKCISSFRPGKRRGTSCRIFCLPYPPLCAAV